MIKWVIRRFDTAKKKPKGVVHTFDRNGSLVVSSESLLSSPAFRRQMIAGAKIVARAKQQNLDPDEDVCAVTAR